MVKIGTVVSWKSWDMGLGEGRKRSFQSADNVLLLDVDAEYTVCLVWEKFIEMAIYDGALFCYLYYTHTQKNV